MLEQWLPVAQVRIARPIDKLRTTRLANIGYPEVVSENLYWKDKGAATINYTESN